jgi:hypothetical protein
MPDALREWLKRLSVDESLQGTVGPELYRQLKLPAGMVQVATTSTFLTLIQMPDSITGKLSGQGLRKSAGTRAAMALLLAEMMLRFMAANLVKLLRGPATVAGECAAHWLKLDSARIASRRFLSLTWMTRHIADGRSLSVRNKASLLADAITLANNHLATNWIQRLEMTRGTVDDGTLDGYTPLSATAREPLVPGKSMRFRRLPSELLPRKPKAILDTATEDHLANVQELSDESNGDEGEAAACEPSGDAAKVTYEQWLRDATTSLDESEARRLVDQAGRNDLVQSCLTATEEMLTHRAEGIDQDIAKVAAATEESVSTLHRGVQSAMAGLSFVQLQADATAAKLEQVNAAIRSIEDRAQERHQSQVAELGRTFTEFGESFKTHLSTEQRKHAKHVESSMQKLTTLVETQHEAFRTHMTEQISEVRGEMKNTISKDVPNFVGAMIAETVKGGHGTACEHQMEGVRRSSSRTQRAQEPAVSRSRRRASLH